MSTAQATAQMRFSVLMSVYHNERPSFLAACLNSLTEQTLPPTELVLVEDGPISDSLSEVIDGYRSRLPIISLKLATNIGLAGALNAGLARCSSDLVVRMDSDDVALPHRFATQVTFMQAHPDISVCSAWVYEMDQQMHQMIFEKKLPTGHLEIQAFSKRRNPINHPASIFRRRDVLAVGGYPLVFPEDYALWSLMLVKGFRFANIPEVLVHMRTGDDFIGRRGASFLLREFGLVSYQRSIGFLDRREAWLFMLSRVVLRMSPPALRKLLYRFKR